jgi:NAD(P)-dependent dehydrogenase (short-subunit alcohol dehydrogenase family)
MSNATQTSVLTGKVALVTGGSRGIGAAIAERLAADGADVALTYAANAEAAEKIAAKIRQLGRKALALKADSGDAAEISGAVAAVHKAFGRLDILVNSAGMVIHKPFAELEVADYDRVMNVNVRGVFLASQAASTVLSDQGRIISIGSNLADRSAFPGLTLYTMSKTALTGLTKGLARDLGSRGITVNLVQPGSTNTDMNPEDGAMADGQRSLMAIPRFGTPQDVAGLVSYLAGPEARSITGASLTMDGGFNA